MRVMPSQNKLGHRKRFCSRECQRHSAMVPCSVCGKLVLRLRYEIEQQKNVYCSNKCKGVGKRKPRIEIVCAFCGKKIAKLQWHIDKSNNNYCSSRCNNKSKVTGRYKFCEICGKEFWAFVSAEKRGAAAHCSQECANIATRSESYDPYSRKNNKRWASEVKKRDGYVCQLCFSSEALHAHHVLSWKDYPKLRFDVNNGVTLCEGCHIDWHKKEIIGRPLFNKEKDLKGEVVN